MIRLLPVRSKRDHVCPLAGRFLMFPFQHTKETRGCRSLFPHRNRKYWILITELADPDRLCGKRLVSRITYRNGFRSRRIIGELNLISDQSRFRFILSALETDTGALVYFTYLMVQKCFGYTRDIQIGEETAVTVPFPNFKVPPQTGQTEVSSLLITKNTGVRLVGQCVF